MKKIAAFLLSTVITMLLVGTPCLAASDNACSSVSIELQAVTTQDSTAISFSATVTDLDTGEEYHAELGKPYTFEVIAGHQYAVNINAALTPVDNHNQWKWYHVLIMAVMLIVFVKAISGSSHETFYSCLR